MNSIFFTQFLSVSSPLTLVFLFGYIALAFLLRRLSKQRVSFSSRVMTATLLGLAAGFIIQATSGFSNDPSKITFVKETLLWYGLVGNGFVSLIRMLVIPLVMVSIIHVILHMEEGDHIKRLVRKGILITMGMVAVAAVIGLSLGMLFQVGGSAEVVQKEMEMKEIVPIASTLLDLIPANPIAAMLEYNIVGVVIFSAFIGTAARRMNKKYPDILQVFYQMINALHKIIISMAMTIIKGMPYAVLALLAITIAQRGLASVLEVGKFILLLYAACIIMLLFQLFMLALHKVNPLIYVKKSLPTLLLAFTSRSSLGVLPATMETLEKELGVSSATANFVASLGTTAGMQGCAGVFPAMLVAYTANSTGMTIDVSFFLMAVLVVVIGSLGIAGIPGTSTMAASLSLSGTGLGSYFSYITPILAIDPLVDMMRTMLNVSGSMTNAIMTDRQLGRMDMALYHRKKTALQQEEQ